MTLGKPVIPLLMEKMSWPPPGSMGPIFGEYIFVRFFQRPGESAGDERYWPKDKFTELLMQLRYNIAPEKSLILKGETLIQILIFCDLSLKILIRDRLNLLFNLSLSD